MLEGRIGDDGQEGLSLFMILPSAVRHYKHMTFIPPEVEIVSQVSKHGIKVVRVLPSFTLKSPERSEQGDERTLFVPMREGRSLIYKIFDHLHKFGLVNSEFRKSPCDLIFLRNDITPALLFDGLQALYLRRRYGSHIVFQMENPLGQNLASRLTQARRHEWSARMISWFEAVLVHRLIQRADLILPINEPLHNDLLQLGVEEKRISVIEEGVRPERFLSPNGASIRARYGLEGSQIIVYSGMIDRARNLKMLILAFAELRKRRPAKLLMVGDGNDTKGLIAMVDQMGLKEDVVFTRWVAPEKVPDFIAAGDVGVCLVPPLDFYLKSSPLKMLEYMAAGRAVIANHEIPEQKQVAEESGCGLLVDYDPIKVADGLEKLLGDPESLVEHGERGRAWVLKHRSYDILSAKAAKRLAQLSDAGR
ncbi:MAG: glycosyltransferase family 4 protein [Methanomassiliicoccales archaeon]|nr:glycosyltransferase family 4 protein [Methanomassiliicoccales archaeon]